MDAHPALSGGIAGYRLFFGTLALTAFGSGWYSTGCRSRWLIWLLGAAAVASVAWWRYTDLHGAGDLRPYLLLQLLPLILIPLLQHLAARPTQERLMFAAAIGIYVLAKICELADRPLLDAFALLSGHTLKHLLACLAAMALTRQLAARIKTTPAA